MNYTNSIHFFLKHLLWIIIFQIACFIIVGRTIYVRIKNKKTIKENCVPRSGIIVDVLIKLPDFRFYLIIKDKASEKLYITYGKYDYTYYSNSYLYSFGFVKHYNIWINNHKEVKIGDTVNLYINKEIEILKVEDGIIDKNNLYWVYYGTRKDTRIIKKHNNYWRCS